MPDAFTPILGLTQPEVGSSSDTWGNKTNDNWLKIDNLFGTGAGSVIRGNFGVAQTKGVNIDDIAGNAKQIQFMTSTALRWDVFVNATAEGGANAGSDFQINRYADNGTTLLGIPLFINRATGAIQFDQIPKVGTDPVVTVSTLPGALSEPVGTVKMYVGTSDPAGGFYMLCDGRAISRTTFATLFAVIGTVYGAGDGSTTFNIPDTQERVIVGKSATQTRIPQFDCRAMGNSFGEGRHTQILAELPIHSHTITDPGHTHGLTYRNANNNPATGAGANVDQIAATGLATAINTASGNTGITATNNVGSGNPMNVVQPSLVMQYIIRVQ